MAEKSLSELPRDLRVLFTKGNDALQRDNFDYAIDLFNQVLAREPALYECRKALRTAQLQKAGGGGGFFKKMLSSASSSPLIAKGQMALRKDPAEALQIAEQVLNGDPQNSGAHKLVVEAAIALEMPQTAVLSLEILAGQFAQGQGGGHSICQCAGGDRRSRAGGEDPGGPYRSFPPDNDLAQALKDLSARKTLDEGGYDALADGSGSYRDILKNKDEAVSLEQQNRQVKTEDVAERLIREYEARLQDRAQEPETGAFTGRAVHAEEAVRPGAGLLRADQGVGPRQRRLAGPRIAETRSSGNSTTRFRSSTRARPITRRRRPNSRPRNRPTSWPNARNSLSAFPPTCKSASSWGSSTSKPAKSARPSRNFRRPRPTRTGASPP